jgi:hypothetical protein
MKDFIIEKANHNIGSLCLFLKNPKNKEYLNLILDNIPQNLNVSLSERIYYFVNSINLPVLCDCGKHRSFIGFKNGYRPTCGDKECYVKKRKETCLEKYGVDNPNKSKEIQNKSKETIQSKWGKHYMLIDEVRDKFNNTMKERHGVEWAQQSKDINEKSLESWKNNPNKEEITRKRADFIKNKSEEEKKEIDNKRKNTIIEKWGKHYMLDFDVKNKLKKRFIENYGVDSPFKNESVSKKRIESYRKRTSQIIKEILGSEFQYINHFYNKNQTGIVVQMNHILCDNTFDINMGYLKNRISSNKNPCLICNPILTGRSQMEIEVSDFIKANYNGSVIDSYKIDNIEIDIYLPELNIGIEFNGLYWHSEEYKDRMFHFNKTKKCKDLNINLIHIWEDDWICKRNIVESILLNKVNKSNKIFARKCIVKEVNDNNLIRNFLLKNHIQGFIGSKVKLGLFYNDELVSLMTFGNLRKSLGQKSEEGSYEMLRFCSLLNHAIIGGASKILNFFIKTYNPKSIISYSDNSRSNGNLYSNLGFNLISNGEPNYYYVIEGIRYHRFNYRKDKLVSLGYDSNKTEVQIMHELGYYRIFDCGSKKWILNL